MHIKKLEISGFKSFVDRTVIHFDEDVIGIVGPNGCGKSNIVDAIRWCIGEQSAKHLRGKAMSDVIFSGSESRGPHGMAEVTLTFDNSDQEAAQSLPLEYRDWADIAVTRRLYRDGTSEYLINKTHVRLRDVTELFLGTGVGTKAYSIIEQGKIGLIVSARPEDRRLLIEEAAGITKYKARRRQAELKMDATRQNLLRVGDIVSEIERNLSSLKRQAAKAERYVSYKNELDDLMLHEASHKYLELVVLRQVEASAHLSLAEEEQAARAALDAREAELEVARLEAHQAEERTEAAQNEAWARDNDVRTHEAELIRLTDQIRRLDAQREAAKEEQLELDGSLAALTAERATLELTLEDADREEATAADRHEQEARELEELQRAQLEAEQAATALRKSATDAVSAVAAAEATLAGFERRSLEMEQRRDRLEDEEGRLVFEIEDLEQRKESLAKHSLELAEGKRISALEREALDEEMRELRTRTVEQERQVDVAKNEHAVQRSRLRALEELHARLEGVGAGVKSLLQSGDDALAGLVADRFEAPAHLTQALSGLLGGELQSIVVHDVDRALSLLDALADENRGRATIVPSRPQFVAGASPCPPRGEGVVGPLVDLVQWNPEDEALARTLIGDAVVVDSVEAARRLVASGVRATIVTLGGTVFHTDGRVAGGAGDAVAAGMVEHKREIRELHEVVAKLGDEVSALLEERQSLRLRMTDIGTALDRARAEDHQGEVALVTAEKDQKRVEEQLAGVSRRLAAVRQELQELRDSLGTAGQERERAEAVVRDGHQRRDDAERALATAESTAGEWRERVQAKQSVVTERKVLLAQVRERAAGVRGTVERLGRSCDEMRARIGRLDEQQIECATEAGVAAAKLIATRELSMLAVVAARGAHDELTIARRLLDEVRNALGEREADLKGLRGSLAATTEQLRKHEMALQRIDLETDHLLGGVRERFRGLELPRVIGDYHKRPPADETHRARIVELANLIDRMGPVNVDAVREHAETEERFKYYTEQVTDLEKALADLERAIAQMNRESRRLFKETFDGVNARFRELFPIMFRGGTAELRLTNPDDMLETGIEILAQPPGKKLGNIELMSGGEKALTAVSLIFAIFQHKPSPFCILDEVDAPLDEANVTRYNEAIRSMTNSSQFILITHIKRTMQSVDVLYGVTMQEPGVSKLVSVRVNESASRSQRRSQAPGATAEESAAVA